MTFEIAAADHAFNVVRREIQEEFPDISLFFVLYQKGEREKAFEKRSDELAKHPASRLFLPILKQEAKKNGREFCGISIAKTKKYLPFSSKRKAMACYFVNADRFQNSDDARSHALFLAWHGLSLIEDYKEDRKNFFEEKAGIITLHRSASAHAWKNMLADAFAALVMEMGGRKDSIGSLGRKRSLAAVSAQAGARPEFYPFPMVFEATRLVYMDSEKTTSHAGLIHKALDMTREIGETFDMESVKQWRSFIKPAQEMAWMGIEKNNIISAAVYNSEDYYARATAYLIADALNIQTTIPNTAGYYNSFAESETNERYHLKTCEESFRHALTRSNLKNNSSGFMDETRRQNKRMLDGNPIGWCSYPLLCSEIAYRTSTEKAKATFEKAMTEAPWEKVEQTMLLIIALKRKGIKITPEIVAKEIENIEELKFLAPCFLATS
ncbi:MAG: hypothetical protein WBK77_06115 [Alphaproteobacteria bacterium]